jgi:tight adherence protein B
MAAVFVFVLAVGVVVGAFVAFTRLPGMMAQRRLNARLESVSHTVEQPQDAAVLLKEQHEGLVDRIASRSARGSAIAKWVEQSGVRISMSTVLVMSLGLAFVIGLVVAAAIRMPVGWLVGGALGFFIPFFFLAMKRKKRLRLFEETFPEALDLMSRALKAGHAFATGLKMVADEMPEPIGPEFRKTFDEQNFGLPLKDALGNLTERIPLLDVRFFSTAVLIQRETGGNLSEILENLAHVVRERFKILRQVRVYTAHGRLTGYVLLALPAFLAIALSFISPEHMQLLLRERMGHIMLMGAVFLQTAGYFWIRQVVKIEV